MWVVIIYDRGDKVNSHILQVEAEDEAQSLARKWIMESYGKEVDWSLHRITIPSDR